LSIVIEIVVTVNGEQVSRSVADDLLLCDFLRESLGLVGTRVGCNEGVCGNCTVLVDGELVRGCLMLAAQVDGCEVLSVEGLASGGTLHPLQRAFVEHGAIQCGFCTAGMLLTAKVLLDATPRPSPAEIRDALAGNLCRCTGYGKIIDAVMAAAELAACPGPEAPAISVRGSG
jgi:aerobic-type carbon monoxide dehydrogenase small subunit (CoxS/CutS family)